MAANALPIRFTELLQVRLRPAMNSWADLEYQLTCRYVQLTHTEIDVREATAHITSSAESY